LPSRIPQSPKHFDGVQRHLQDVAGVNVGVAGECHGLVNWVGATASAVRLQSGIVFLFGHWPNVGSLRNEAVRLAEVFQVRPQGVQFRYRVQPHHRLTQLGILSAQCPPSPAEYRQVLVLRRRQGKDSRKRNSGGSDMRFAIPIALFLGSP
jgi:hypothetical protein